MAAACGDDCWLNIMLLFLSLRFLSKMGVFEVSKSFNLDYHGMLRPTTLVVLMGDVCGWVRTIHIYFWIFFTRLILCMKPYSANERNQKV